MFIQTLLRTFNATSVYLLETFSEMEATYQIQKRKDKLKELQKEAETMKLLI